MKPHPMSKVHNQTLLDDMVRHQSLPMTQVKQAANEILAIIREGLVRDGVVNVSNFGTFRLKPVAERHGINPQTREAIIIPAHQRVIFSPCKALRELIQPVHKPPVPLQPEEVTIPEARDETVLTVQPHAKETPVPETTNQPPIANTEEVTAVAIEQNAITLPKEAPSANDEKSAVSSQITEQQQPVAASESIDLLQTTPVDAAVQENPITENSNHDAIEQAIVEQHTTPQTELVTGRKYTKATALLLIALVCTGLFFEFGYNRDTETETTAKNTTTTLTQTAVSTNPISYGDTSETDSSDSQTPITESTATAGSDNSAQANTAPTSVAAVESQTKTQDSDSDAVPNDAQVTPVSNTSTAAVQDENKLAPDTSTSAEFVPSTATVKPAEIFFQERQHQITHGESLWRLSRKYFQDPLLWPHIFQANASTINDPDHLAEGGSIIIPTLEGSPDKLSRQDRHNIAEGYYLTYEHYKKIGRHEAFFALLEAKRYDNSVVEEHRRLLHLSQVEEIMLETQETMPF